MVGGTGHAGVFLGGNVGIGVGTPDVRLHVGGGTDTAPGSGGYLVLGGITGTNISMDNNEIMARNNSAPSTLYLNNQGGDVRIRLPGHPVAGVVEQPSFSGMSEPLPSFSSSLRRSPVRAHPYRLDDLSLPGHWAKKSRNNNQHRQPGKKQNEWNPQWK